MVVGTIIATLGPAVLSQIIQIEMQRGQDRAIRITPGDILRGALAIQALSEGGLVPVASTDPFTGDLVISTQDQSPVLETLLGEKFARETLAATPGEIEEVRTFRDQVIDSLSMPTARVTGPGVVSRGSRGAATSRRLGGPCAAANTGFSRLNCARGGFA